jgi:hypothetical protein
MQRLLTKINISSSMYLERGKYWHLKIYRKENFRKIIDGRDIMSRKKDKIVYALTHGHRRM